jgi:hypothetical protein
VQQYWAPFKGRLAQCELVLESPCDNNACSIKWEEFGDSWFVGSKNTAHLLNVFKCHAAQYGQIPGGDERLLQEKSGSG